MSITMLAHVAIAAHSKTLYENVCMKIVAG